MHRTLLFCALFIFGFFSVAPSQEAPASPGTRVRVWTQVNESGRPTGQQMIGEVVTWTADSLVLTHAEGRDPRAVPITSISRLDVSVEPNSKQEGERIGRMRGLLIGGLAGAVFGLLQGDDTSCTSCYNAEDKAGMYGMLFGATGWFVGARLGASRGAERWERISLPARVSILPRKQGLALSSSVPF